MVRFTNDVYADVQRNGPEDDHPAEGATEAYVIGTHRGESNFMVHGLDSGNRVTDYVDQRDRNHALPAQSESMTMTQVLQWC